MPDLRISAISERIWQFLRGDLPTTEFEQWVYSTPELEGAFNPDVYLELISIDYRNKLAVNHIKDTLRDCVEGFERSCECITWKNDEQISVGGDPSLLTYGTAGRNRFPYVGRSCSCFFIQAIYPNVQESK